MIENEYEKRFKQVTGLNFTTYFNEHNPKIACYLTNNFTHNPDRSKEYTQRAFMQALNKIDTYDSTKSALQTWITKIAINLVIKDWKDAQRMDIVSVDAEIQDTPGFINIIKHDDGEIENQEHNENVKKCQIIFETIKTLPDKYKKVMVMREIQRMHYKDIADNIRKEEKKVIKHKTYKLSTPEDFYSLDIENKGDEEVTISFVSCLRDPLGMKNSYTRVIRPHHSFFVVREELEWDRTQHDSFEVISDNSECNISYITTTNLSTIKSQIKKGRSLIQRKVKRKFDLMEK